MKLSNKILIGGYIFVTLLGLSGLITIGVWGNKSGKTYSDYSTAEKSITFDEGFTKINFSGVFDIELNNGIERSMQITGSEEYVKGISYKVDGDSLRIKGEDTKGSNNGTIIVTLPFVDDVSLNGVGNLVFKNFADMEELNLRLQGVFNTEINGIKISSLIINADGVGNIDIRDSSVKDLNLKSSLIGDIRIDVNNLNANGSASGMGSITLVGTINSNNISISGGMNLVTR